MKYHFTVHKEGTGFWAQCIELVGCVTEADSMEELQKNMEEALNLYIEEPEDSKELAPLPDELVQPRKNIIEVALDPQIAFAFLLRYYRAKHAMTQKQAAKKMGFDTLYSYQRLEGRHSNPSLRIMTKVKKAFPDFSVDYAMNV